MHKQKFMHLLCFTLSFLMLSSSFFATTYALSIDSYFVDDTTAWTKLADTSSPHMGSRNATFIYASPAVKDYYGAYITSGISLWGTNIYCVEDNNAQSGGVITVSAMDSTATASVGDIYVYTDTNHIALWALTIYSANFDNNSYAGKCRTIAHEIGHAYGLGHVDYENQIMYHTYSETKNVTLYDKAGMDVMTHAHTHNSNYEKVLEEYSTYSHKVRCITCGAYSLANCTYTDYHSGIRHVLSVNCACGNQTNRFWACSGNPCVMPFSFSPHHEIE